jgi:hypothetical protein
VSEDELPRRCQANDAGAHHRNVVGAGNTQGSEVRGQGSTLERRKRERQETRFSVIDSIFIKVTKGVFKFARVF